MKKKLICITLPLLAALLFSGCLSAMLTEEFNYTANLNPIDEMDNRSYLYSGDHIYPVRFAAESVVEKVISFRAEEDIINLTFSPALNTVLMDTTREYMDTLGIEQDPRSQLELTTRLTEIAVSYEGSNSLRLDSLAFNSQSGRYWSCDLTLVMELMNKASGKLVWEHTHRASTQRDDPKRILKYGADNISSAISEALDSVPYEELLDVVNRETGHAMSAGGNLTDYSRLDDSDYEDILKVLARDILSGSGEMNLAVLDILNANGSPSVLGNFVEEELYTNLVRSAPQDISIIERARINQIMSEWQLGSSGVVNEETAVQIGQLVGANAIVMGSITRISDSVRVNIRIVDVETAQILSTASATLKGEGIAELYDQPLNQ